VQADSRGIILGSLCGVNNHLAIGARALWRAVKGKCHKNWCCFDDFRQTTGHIWVLLLNLDPHIVTSGHHILWSLAVRIGCKVYIFGVWLALSPVAGLSKSTRLRGAAIMKPLLGLTHPSSTGYIARGGDGLGSRLSFFSYGFLFPLRPAPLHAVDRPHMQEARG
jgi:hypothetical protein